MQVTALRARFLTPTRYQQTWSTASAACLRSGPRRGKAEQAITRVTEGRLNAFYADNVLLEQESVREPKTTVKQVLAQRQRHGHQVRALRGRSSLTR